MPNIGPSKIHDDAVQARHLAPDAVSAETIADGSVITDKLANNAVTTDKIEDGAVTADKLANNSVYSPSIATVADNNAGQMITVPLALPNVAGDVDVVLPFKAEVVGVQAWKRGAPGGAGDTVTIKNGATAITNAISLNIVDNAPATASTLDDAASTIASGGTLRATVAKATNTQALVLVQLIKRT